MTAAPLGRWCPLVNGTLMARKTDYDSPAARPGRKSVTLTWAFALERVTGIDPHYQLGKQAGLSAECFPVLILHVRSSHMSNGCAGIQPCPTSL